MTSARVKCIFPHAWAGAGMSVVFIIAGVLGVIVGLGAYAFPAVKNAEDILPDHMVEQLNDSN